MPFSPGANRNSRTVETMSEAKPTGPLAGIKVLDLSRVLAGPWTTQILGDLDADVIKVEQPGKGDDTRAWGPPFLDDGSRDSAYYLCANRNKRSIAVNMADPEGAAILRKLAEEADILVENFRVGGLAKYGLDYQSLRQINPGLIYCSITGFGQDGPYKDKGGYDFLIQGLSGLMSVTGRPDGVSGDGPLKVGIPISDLATGLYAAVSILAALNHRNRNGEGQHIDCALLDTQVSLLSNQASNYLNGGMIPRRLGNQHPNTVPYQDFGCIDGEILVALGNDRQFRDLCVLLDRSDLASDERYGTNAGRSVHRVGLVAELSEATARWKSDELIAAMEEAKLPAGKVNEIPDIIVDPHIAARGLVQKIQREDGSSIRFLGFPAKLNGTPASYRHAPPRCGENTFSVIAEKLGLSVDEMRDLDERGVISQQG